jgi:hypothetical protein
MNLAVLMVLGMIPAALVMAQEAEVLAPPAGSEFVMRCDGGTESRWRIAGNAGGKLRVESAADAEIYREGPVWAYMLGDIYEVQGLGKDRGRNRMFLARGPAEGVKTLSAGARHRFTYRWLSPSAEAERSHVITVRETKRVATAAFGEQQVFEVTDDISSPLHDLRRTVQYAPALRIFVTFAIRNNRSGFEQRCELASLKMP